MKRNLETIIRAFIAGVVVITTFLMTWSDAAIPRDWEAIFLLVIGYYFSDRPKESELVAMRARGLDASGAQEAAVDAELLSQLAIALLLVGVTIALFMQKVHGAFRSDVSPAWISGAALAVAFYFKTPVTEPDPHLRYRALIAIVVVLATLPIAWLRGWVIPLQWITLVLVVIVFYFKERAAAQRP